ncbi:tyrosine-protein phosphatase 69D-like [Sitodiplosis mosellana]|uniref:tyrosine-protein phosphatase 69D-like n=1 Tax=Sitodiplosis mosellana TaxID=263140 RepID=UPI002444782F|nr:tyrosine-protein phosphatase 69D-like [Sitodiplosis mosellana]
MTLNDLGLTVRDSGALNSDVGPAVVHCSAGIGRSGTFCLVDSCLVLVEKEGENKISVPDLLLKLRQSRMGLIQTADQLYFSYQAIIEGIKHFNDPTVGDYDEVAKIDNEDYSTETDPPRPPPRCTSILQSQHKPLPTVPTNDNDHVSVNNNSENGDGTRSERPLPPLPDESPDDSDSEDIEDDSDEDMSDEQDVDLMMTTTTMTTTTMVWMMTNKPLRSKPQNCSTELVVMEAMSVKTVSIRMQRYHRHQQNCQPQASPNSTIRIHHWKHRHHRRTTVDWRRLLNSDDENERNAMQTSRRKLRISRENRKKRRLLLKQHQKNADQDDKCNYKHVPADFILTVMETLKCNNIRLGHTLSTDEVF